MKNIIISLLIFLLGVPSVMAQSSATPEFVPTRGQKGVRTSTDVLAIAMPAATLAYVLITQDWQGLKQGAFTAAATAGASLLLKYTVKKERPDFSNNHSFPSGHTAVTFATASFLMRRYGWKVGVPAYVLSTYVGWGRIYGKKHDIWDVLAGAAIGAGSAFIFTRPFAEKHELQIAPVSDGQSVGLVGQFTF